MISACINAGTYLFFKCHYSQLEGNKPTFMLLWLIGILFLDHHYYVLQEEVNIHQHWKVRGSMVLGMPWVGFCTSYFFTSRNINGCIELGFMKVSSLCACARACQHVHVASLGLCVNECTRDFVLEETDKQHTTYCYFWLFLNNSHYCKNIWTTCQTELVCTSKFITKMVFSLLIGSKWLYFVPFQGLFHA